jgi:hypothetical protein
MIVVVVGQVVLEIEIQEKTQMQIQIVDRLVGHRHLAVLLR